MDFEEPIKMGTENWAEEAIKQYHQDTADVPRRLLDAYAARREAMEDTRPTINREQRQVITAYLGKYVDPFNLLSFVNEALIEAGFKLVP